jgi:hypothetical protein
MHTLPDKFKDLPLIYTDVLKAVFVTVPQVALPFGCE